MTRFTESGPDEEPVAELTTEQAQSLLSAASTAFAQEGLPSLTLEVTYPQWQEIWKVLGGNPIAASLQLTVNGTPVLSGFALPETGLTAPCPPQAS